MPGPRIPGDELGMSFYMITPPTLPEVGIKICVLVLLLFVPLLFVLSAYRRN